MKTNFLNAAFGKLRSPDFQNQLWTLIATALFAIFPSVFILVTTRVIGLDNAGIIAYTVALIELPRLLIIFGIRSYQATDIKQEFKFSIYFGLRTITAAIVSMIFATFVVLSGFDSTQFIVLLLIYFIFLTESYADVFMGDLQQKGRMRVAGKMQASVYLSVILVYIVALLITRSMPFSLLLVAVASFFIYITWIWMHRNHFGAIRVKVDLKAIKKLALSVLPLVIAGLLFVYLVNAQKYYLEAFLSRETVAIYAILVLPVSLLMLACIGFFQGAIMTKTASILAAGDKKRFTKRVSIQLLCSLALAVPFMLCVYFLGVPVLSWLYGIDLSPYRTYLIILSLGGTLRLPLSVISPVLIILRKQRALLYSIVISAVIAGPLMWWLVSQYGLYGASFSNIIIFIPQVVLAYIMYRVALRS